MQEVRGAGLAAVRSLEVVEGAAEVRRGESVAWTLRGVASHERYTTRAEHEALATRQERLGRAGSSCAALIALTKSDAWWALAQDERRRLFEERSAHVAIGLDYLPAIARRLHHGRDLGEPFDFLTWFEFAPASAPAFEDLVQRLRGTPEWTYVEREVDLRLEATRR